MSGVPQPRSVPVCISCFGVVQVLLLNFLTKPIDFRTEGRLVLRSSFAPVSSPAHFQHFVYFFSRLFEFLLVRRHARPNLHAMPLFHLIPQGAVHKALLSE